MTRTLELAGPDALSLLEPSSCLTSDLSGLEDSEKQLFRASAPDQIVSLEQAEAENAARDAAKAAMQYPDYLAQYWRDSDYSCITPGRTSDGVQFLILHFMDGYGFWNIVNWGRSARSGNSWNYGTALDGTSVQIASEADTTWHCGNWWYNQRSIGYEQEGKGTQGDWNETMLRATAKLVAGGSYRHNVPVNRTHIKGHSEVGNHTDVQPHFPWTRFLNLVTEYRRGAKVPDKPGPIVIETKVKFVNSGHGAVSPEKDKKVAAAAVAGFRAVDLSSAVTQNVVKAAKNAQAQEGVYTVLSGKAACDPVREELGDNVTNPNGKNYGIEATAKDSIETVGRWRVAAITKIADKNAGISLAAYQKTIDESAEPSTPGAKKSPIGGEARGRYELAGRQRYGRGRCKEVARAHGAHPRFYTMIDALFNRANAMRNAIGEPVAAPDVLSMESGLETAWGKYGAAAEPWNYAGIKKAGNRGDAPIDFDNPASVALGAQQFLNHMSIYIGGDPWGQVHARYEQVKLYRAGKPVARTVDDLARAWATDPLYAVKIRSLLDELEGSDPKPVPVDEDTLAERKAALWNYFRPGLGKVPYGWWTSGYVPDEEPAGACNKPPPSQAYFLSKRWFCVAPHNIGRRMFGLTIPYNPAQHVNSRLFWDGGTLATFAYYRSKGVLKTFRNQDVQPWDLCLRNYRDASANQTATTGQGHAMIAVPGELVGRPGVLMAFQTYGNPWPGLNAASTVSESHAGWFYEGIVPASAWMGPKAVTG